MAPLSAALANFEKLIVAVQNSVMVLDENIVALEQHSLRSDSVVALPEATFHESLATAAPAYQTQYLKHLATTAYLADLELRATRDIRVIIKELIRHFKPLISCKEDQEEFLKIVKQVAWLEPDGDRQAKLKDETLGRYELR